VAYPRADPSDAGRLPADTWAAAAVPATVRLELVGDAEAVELRYRTATRDFGYRGPSAGHTFAAWCGTRMLDEVDALEGEGTARLSLAGADGGRVTIYLPEGMRPVVLALHPLGGEIEPAPPQPRWVAYGDSILEGWIASGPATSWPAVGARTLGLDVVNMGYAGAARGEIVSAEHVATVPAAVVSISHGTNCWTRIPHSAGQMRENTAAFLEVVRQGHPDTPIVITTPVLRPDAEAVPNRLGATLGNLREAMEVAVAERIAAGDGTLTLVRGDAVLEPRHLPDGIHPGDEGHAVLATVFGGAVAAALRS